MARLEWKNVDAPDFSGVSRIMDSASNNLNNGFNSLKSGMEAARLRKQENASNALIPQLAGVGSEAEVDAFLKNMNIDPRNMTPELAQAVMGLRKGAMGYDTQRLENNGIVARTGLTNQNTTNARDANNRTNTTFGRNITREDQLAAMGRGLVEAREGAYTNGSNAQPSMGRVEGSATQSGGNVPKSEVANRLYSKMIAKGLPEHVAQGFLMNFEDESGFSSSINEKNPTVAGSRGGFGIYQLTGPRRRAYERYADAKGVPYSDEDAQLDFMIDELGGTEKSAANKIFSTSNDGEAGAAIVENFLRPAEQHRKHRVSKYLGDGGSKYSGAVSSNVDTVRPTGNGGYSAASISSLIPENSMIDPSTLLGIVDGNYGAFNTASTNRDADRKRDLELIQSEINLDQDQITFGNTQKTFEQGQESTRKAEQVRIEQEQGQNIALEAARTAGSAEEVRQNIINNKDLNPNQVAAALAAADTFATEGQFTPSDDPSIVTPITSDPDLDNQIKQFTDGNNQAVYSNETARVLRRAESLGDEPAQALLNSIPDIQLSKGEILESINDVITGVKRDHGITITPAEAGVMLEENTFKRSFLGGVAGQGKWKDIRFDTDAAIEAAGTIYSDTGRRSAAELKGNADKANGVIATSQASIDRLNKRIALAETRGNEVKPEWLDERNRLQEGMRDYVTKTAPLSNNTRGEIVTGAPTPSQPLAGEGVARQNDVGGNAGARRNNRNSLDRPADLNQTPTLGDTSKNAASNPTQQAYAYKDAVEYMNMDDRVGAALANPNIPLETRVQLMDALIQKAANDRFMPKTKRDAIIKQLESLKSGFTGG